MSISSSLKGKSLEKVHFSFEMGIFSSGEQIIETNNEIYIICNNQLKSGLLKWIIKQLNVAVINFNNLICTVVDATLFHDNYVL